MSTPTTPAAIALGTLLLSCCSSEVKGHQGPPPPMPVQVATAALADVEDFSDYLATIKSRKSVEIRPQVEGHVARIQVKPGDVVAAGATLIKVDGSKQEAVVRSAQARAGIATA